MILSHMDTFSELAKQWATYIERFEQFVSKNYIVNYKQVKLLLRVMGSSTYGLLQSLIGPDKLGKKSYSALPLIVMSVLIRHMFMLQ